MDNTRQTEVIKYRLGGFLPHVIITLDRIGGVMISVLTSSAVDCGFEPRSGQIKDYKIGNLLLLR